MIFDTPYEYCLSDCDGTIVDNGFYPSEATKKSIRKYQKVSGYRFGLITGRLAMANLKLVDDLNVQLPIVACNGAVVMDLKLQKVLFAQTIPNDLVFQIFDDCLAIGVEIMLYSPTQMLAKIGAMRIEYWIQYQKSIKKKHRWEIQQFETYADLRQAVEEQNSSIVEFIIKTNSDQEEKLLHEIFQKYAHATTSVESYPQMYNITAFGVDKFSGLKKWAEIVNADYQEIVAFGDNYNDLTMIQGVKKGICVGNGVDELKQVAWKIIEPVHENGVGLELERMIAEKD
ncbi:HAD family hydrolase [Williamsoniiplasma luminosum]|uniref:HAD family hydrolase n=1 Tax=Williamsoniiplasma luminosum TaxID=214888 RepID=A0A2K8NXB9_9MOLU|nr:HAD family hydrolase [Williamsoniiplasma luminosum]ATZ17283.1 HAD family hydrolase [Williamsoniiplasma luminosum]